MAGLQKKVIQRYIKDRTNFWAMSIKRPDCLKEILKLDWVESADETSEEDEKKIRQFQQDIIDHIVVTGGCLVSMLLGEEVNDVDIYFTDRDIARKVAQYYLNVMAMEGDIAKTFHVSDIGVKDSETGIDIMIRSQGVAGQEITEKSSHEYRYFEMEADNVVEDFFKAYARQRSKKDLPKHSVAYMTSNAISLENGIQLIFRFVGNVDEIHKNFDFIHCTNYWTIGTGVVYRAEALQAILEKRLVYIGSLFPVSALFRVRKFIGRGYRISAGEIVKIAFDISKLDLEDVTTLRQQLIGCDSAYFNEVISVIKDGVAGGRALDRTYLIEVLDRVFKDEIVQIETDSMLNDEKDGG